MAKQLNTTGECWAVHGKLREEQLRLFASQSLEIQAALYCSVTSNVQYFTATPLTKLPEYIKPN